MYYRACASDLVPSICGNANYSIYFDEWKQKPRWLLRKEYFHHRGLLLLSKFKKYCKYSYKTSVIL